MRVYFLGTKPTLGHYAGYKLLDGDVSKIEVADKTPDAGFDLNTASTYPCYQGRAVKTDFVPTKIEYQEKGPLPDANKAFGLLTFAERFRDVVEVIEPGVHQFLPVDYFDRKGAPLGRQHIFVAGNRLDSVHRERSNMVLVKGMRWCPPSDIAGRAPDPRDVVLPHIDMAAPGALVFSNQKVGDKHAWCDMFMLSGPNLSDALGAALQAENLTGIHLEKCEAA
ncbi:MAG: DUF1629 domain-containing protein [Pseudomonadota bacterium]